MYTPNKLSQSKQELEKIQEESEKQAGVKDYQKQIDQLVYKLYGVTLE